jgi:hypothetical protein
MNKRGNAMSKSIFQPDHAGLPTPQKLDNVHHVADRTHEFEEQRGANIARAGGKPKVSVVQVHGGMTRQQTDAAGIGGMGHATAVVDGGQKLTTDAPAAPLQHAYGTGIPKVRNAAPNKPGMKSRTAQDDLRAAIMGEAMGDKS